MDSQEMRYLLPHCTHTQEKVCAHPRTSGYVSPLILLKHQGQQESNQAVPQELSY
jgi:hypothetical protein